MTGRDPHDPHRAATPLELLYDLVFVISFGVAGSEFAHLAAEGYISEGLIGFVFAMFAVVWAWINFTWFASAFDTDDWIYRLLVMVQMMGVVILAMGLHDMFDSLHHHEPFDNKVMIVGYIVMRVPMIALWARVYRHDPDNRRCAQIYMITLAVSQVLWSLTLLIDVHVGGYLLIAAPIFAIEMTGPYLAERRDGGTPWHPHHIAERYGLLAIIALGEVLIGTVAALNSVIELEGWNADIVVLAVAGVALCFGMWWTYFTLPAGDVLHLRRDRAFGWGYSHILVYASISAVGAGIHVAALYFEHHAEIGPTTVMLTMAVPLVLFMLSVGVLFGYMLHLPRVYIITTIVKVGLVIGAVLIVDAGANLLVGIVVAAVAPWVSVVAIETGLGERTERSLADLAGADRSHR